MSGIVLFIISFILGTLLFFIINLKRGFQSRGVLVWIGCLLIALVILLLLGKIIKGLLIFIIIVLLICVIVKVLFIKL